MIADGAGTGMLTLDLIQDEGGHAANFCEMGGLANTQIMIDAMEVVLANPKAKVLLITLIGGLTRMDEIADGIAQYIRVHGKIVPMVVRMCGTQEEVGRATLHGIGIEPFEDLVKDCSGCSRHCKDGVTMAILIDKNTRVLIQGITGNVGNFQTKVMKDYGTQIVAGITPGKGGTITHGIPVYNFVAEAVADHKIDAAFGFVPGRFTKDAAFEVLEAGIPFVVITTESVPSRDMIQIIHFAAQKGARVIGPDTAGVISPGKANWVYILTGCSWKEMWGSSRKAAPCPMRFART